MRIRPLRKDLKHLLKKQGLVKKFEKQKGLFEANPRHPSLNTEKLQPKHFNIYSFRLDHKWRAVFIIHKNDEIEMVDINPHYYD